MKYVRWALLILFLVPLIGLFLDGIKRGSAGAMIIVFVFALIPITGLFSKKPWFFYYIYIAAPIQFLIISFFECFLSLFGDEAQSLTLWIQIILPFFLYFGVIIVLTAILHKNYKLTHNSKTT